MKNILIVTDAWSPQINGVVTTLTQTVNTLKALGYLVKVINPKNFPSVSCPTYPEISLSITTPKRLYKEICEFNPHSIHISTEGPLGWAVRSVCKKKKFPFTTAYHTRFPEYLRMRFPIPLGLSYMVVRKFHNQAAGIMVATKVLQKELVGRKFKNTCLWSRGVDTDLFKPRAKRFLTETQPVFMYVGRVSVEKNIETFLTLNLPGRKYVVGDGPARLPLEREYPEVVFTGYQKGEQLAKYLAAASVFVFPSKTDTFGVVMLEAMACGVPVAAYPVSGPAQVVRHGETGYLDNDLAVAALKALDLSSDKCRGYAKKHSWQSCTEQFLNNLVFSDRKFSYT